MRYKLPAVFALLILASTVQAQGLYLPGSGAVQGGMAGVSTATPLDAIGALYWNPAGIGRYGQSEASVGGAFLYPDVSVSSTTPRNRTGGRTRSDSGFPITSSLGIIYQPDEGPFTYGLGLFTLGGGGVNFPGDAANPILAPTGPLDRTVIGPIYSSIGLIQLAPTVSYRVNDRLVIGVAPTIDITYPSFDPAFFATADDANGDGLKTFPTATHARPYWGGGFKVGLTYSLTDTLDFGFGYTSEQWLETWKFYARNEVGQAQTLYLKATLPAIYSWGLAWRATEKLLIATDLRYFDYKNTDLFGVPVRDGGLGWDSAFAVAVGANYQLTDRVAVRAGYQYNTNPLDDTKTLFNVQGPAIIQHTISLGSTYAVTDAFSVSMGYAYGFHNSIRGTATQVPAASIELEASSHSLLFNLQMKFGGGCHGGKTSPVNTSAEVN